MTQPNRAARRHPPTTAAAPKKPAPKKESGQLARISALESKVENLQQLVSKLFALIAGPQLQQQLESQILGALESGQPLNLGQTPPQPNIRAV